MSDKVTISKRDSETNEEAWTGMPRLRIQRIESAISSGGVANHTKLLPASSVQWRRI
jgi:hypothetical protein